MKTININLFKFSELSEEAQETAIENWRNRNYETGDYAWLGEIQDSYKAAEKIYGALREIEGEISGARLYTWIINNLADYWIKNNYISKHKDGSITNSDWRYKYDCIKQKRSNVFVTNNLENCPLTGVCYDFDFLEPIIDFLRKPGTGTTNIDLADALPDYDEVADAEIESQNEGDYIRDTIEANDYDFTEDGEMY